MSNKTLVCLYTEGATDKVFYDRLLDYIKTKSANGKFIVDQIKKINIAGIGNFKKKLLNKFKKEIDINKYKDYKKIVVLCYDNDVFEFNPNPPMNRQELEKELINSGAEKVIHCVAKHSIEDIFLKDIDNIVKSLNLNKSIIKNLQGSGYEKMKYIYKKANRVYVKGENVENFVYSLNMEKICNNQCETYCKLCMILLGQKGCKK